MSDSRPRPVVHHVALDANESAPEVTEARSLLRRGQADAAIALLEPLTANACDDPMAFEVLGVAYIQKRQIPAAISAFKAAVQLNPAQPQPHYNLGQALLKAGDRAAAQEAFERSLRVDATYAKAREALAALQAG
jgi:predicted Zn-dependent protease